ncbi:MAG: hypothetical protein AB7F59_13240 [Bdellovibrionales bacterium]
MIKLTLISLLFVSFPTLAAERLAPKLTLRSGFEMLNNVGTTAGSASGGSGFNIVFSYFLTKKLAAGAGYSAAFDMSKGTMPISGTSLFGRYYFWGLGTRMKDSGEWGESIYHDTWSMYTGGAYSNHSYYLGQDPLGDLKVDQLRGSYSTADFIIGVDYRLSKDFEVNAEASNSILAFAASDDRIRIQHTSVYFGLNYLF